MATGNKNRRLAQGWLAEVLRPQVSPQGKAAALRVVIAFVAACAVWSAIEDLLFWQIGMPALSETSTRVIHDTIMLTLLGFVAWRGTLYGVARLEAARRDLYKADLETVMRFARAADLMESYRRGHNVRVGLYSREIATAMRLDERFCQEIMQTAMLHDIGEIGLPDALRYKTEPLTAFERLRMMRHVEVGSDLLISDRRLLAMAGRIARFHHENWDGSGYPEGLASDDIPLEARIVAIADVFDALVTDRPYRPAFSFEFAQSEIQALSGTRFDPSVVEAFLRCENQIKLICNNADLDIPSPDSDEMAHSYGLK